MKKTFLTGIAALFLATGAVSTPTPTLAQCESDTVLQQQVAKFNKLSARCEAAAIKEDNYVMRLWHWKGFMRQILLVTKYKPGSVN
jgi:hypothetical protein